MGSSCKKSDVGNKGPSCAWLRVDSIGPISVKSGIDNDRLSRDIPKVGSEGPPRRDALADGVLPECVWSDANIDRSMLQREKANRDGPERAKDRASMEGPV